MAWVVQYNVFISMVVLPAEDTWYVFINELLIVIHKLFRFREVISLRVKVKFTAGRRKIGDSSKIQFI